MSSTTSTDCSLQISTFLPMARVIMFDVLFQRNKHIEEVTVIYDLWKVGLKHMWKPGIVINVL